MQVTGWIGDWGLWIGDWVNANNTEFTFFFPFHSKIINIFLKKWKKKVNPAEVFCKYLVSTADSGLAPLRGLIAAKDGSNWLGFKKPSIAGVHFSGNFLPGEKFSFFFCKWSKIDISLISLIVINESWIGGLRLNKSNVKLI